MTVKRGQVCFHNGHIIHSSFANTSKVNRLALAVHFQDINNAYQKTYKKDGSPIVIGYDQLCKKETNGDPDYTDENLFPLLIESVPQ
jgi:ectoine hydroxylase-related dioxygenase (phytanoyl-CoA dioxygenase family)